MITADIKLCLLVTIRSDVCIELCCDGWHAGCGCSREKLEAWLAKRGKTPSRYRHMMCFGAHGHHGHAGAHGLMATDGLADGDVGSSAGRVNCHSRVSFKDDNVACSLFTVSLFEWHLATNHTHTPGALWLLFLSIVYNLSYLLTVSVSFSDHI